MTQLDDDLDLEVLRSINADITADPDALARVRQHAVAAWHPRRTVATWPKLIAVAVAALTVGVGVAMLVPRFQTPTPRPSTTTVAVPTLAQFSAEAAQASLLRTPLKPGPGQYRKVTASLEVVKGANSQVPGTKSRAEQVWLRQNTVITTWVPADPKDTWVRSSEEWLLPSDEVSKKYLADHPEFSTHWVTKPERAKAAAFPSIEPFNGKSDWGAPSLPFLDRLAKDPDALLASAKEWNRKHHIANDAQGLLGTLTSPLETFWVDDAELRAAIFTALGKVEGLTVTTDARIGGQRGIALRAAGEGPGEWTEVLFDADDYHVLGDRWHVQTVSGFEREEQTIYTSEVVDSAP